MADADDGSDAAAAFFFGTAGAVATEADAAATPVELLARALTSTRASRGAYI